MDYTYPSVFFAYIFFALMFLLAVYFFVKSWKDGYWGEEAEEIKKQVFFEGDGHE